MGIYCVALNSETSTRVSLRSLFDVAHFQMGERHIMLSYQWDTQELVKKVYQAISDKGVNVWMDIEGGVTGQ